MRRCWLFEQKDIINKTFFWSPRNKELRDQWMEAIGRKFKVESGFVVCEDHFDMTNDDVTIPFQF